MPGVPRAGSTREHELDARREGERLEHADPAAEASHHRDLDRAREARPGPRARPRRRHPATDSSLWKRLKSLPSVSVQCANQPTCGIGCLSSGRAAELAHLRDRRVDVVGVEVDDHAALLVRGRWRRPGPRRFASSSTPCRACPESLNVPAEDAAPELLRAVGVLRRQLEVNELSWHRLGSSGRRKGTMVRAFVLYAEAAGPGTLRRARRDLPPRRGRDLPSRTDLRLGRQASRSTATTPSSSFRTVTASTRRCARPSSKPPGSTPWQWAFRSRCSSPMSTEAPRAGRARRARLRADRLHEGAAAGDDPP